MIPYTERRSWSNQPVAKGRTDRKGLLELKYSSDGDLYPVMATVSKGSDIAFIRFDNGLYGGKDIFGTNGDPWVYKGYSAYCFTPRDVFRPGENIPLTAVVRDSGNAFSKPFPVNIKVFNSKGSLSFSHTELLTKEGTISKEFHVPADAPTGTWYANVTLPGEEQAIAGKNFMSKNLPHLGFCGSRAAPRPHRKGCRRSLSRRDIALEPASGLRGS